MIFREYFKRQHRLQSTGVCSSVIALKQFYRCENIAKNYIEFGFPS